MQDGLGGTAAGRPPRSTDRRLRPVPLLLSVTARIAPSLKPRLQKWLTSAVYQSLSLWDRRDGVLLFMNYGYTSLDSGPPNLRLEPEDERDRLAIQLYQRVVGAVDLRGLDVLEVGCGRGGGASYIMRYLGSRSVTGVDLAGQAIAYCRRRHRMPRLIFRRGDAEALPFPAAWFDAVVNVESSHWYPQIRRFFAGVRRVLRPGGYFLFADFRPAEQVGQLRRELLESGLALVEEERLTPNVVRALELDSDRRLATLDSRAPPWLRAWLHEFAAVKGTTVYHKLRSGELEYLRFVLLKPGAEPRRAPLLRAEGR